MNRREFLAGCGAAAASLGPLDSLAFQIGLHGVALAKDGAPTRLPSDAERLPLDHVRRLADAAMDLAVKAKTTYADIRLCLFRTQNLSTRDRKPERLDENASRGFGIRILHGGGWGFASSPEMTLDGVSRTFARALELAKASASIMTKPWPFTSPPKYEDDWTSPYKVDPFSISIGEKMALLLEAESPASGVEGIKHTNASMGFEYEEKFFASTVGSRIRQVIHRSQAYLEATAVGPEGFKSRYFDPIMRNAGYEDVRDVPWAEKSQRIARDAVEYVKAAAGPQQVRKDLILLPSHLHLTIHESVGHPTELDRALLWEADFAGTSFATPEKVGSFEYGSKLVNFTGDRTMEHGRSTVKYDDDGTRTTRWPIVREGVFMGHASDRISAALVGKESTACAHADSWRVQPIVRMPNLSLDPDPNGPTLDELIADTKDGILIDGRGSYSIDHQRKNFQFGGDMFWEIKDGKRSRPLRDVTYHANTWEFWRSCDAICRTEFWEPWGVNTCGKGQPSQRGQMTHGCAPARFRQVQIGELT